jgi:hypothetical protein
MPGLRDAMGRPRDNLFFPTAAPSENNPFPTNPTNVVDISERSRKKAEHGSTPAYCEPRPPCREADFAR